MEQINTQNYLHTLQARAQVNTGVEYSFQEVGKQMQEKFDGNIWWLFHRYPEDKIRAAFKVCQERDIYKTGYLIGVLKKL